LDLKGKAVIVTGASKGIGKAVATEFARRGANLALVARSAALLSELERSLEGYPGKRLCLVTDVTRRDQVEAMVDKTVAAFGRIDVLVNNAGIGFSGRIANVDPDQIGLVFATNVMGPLYAIHAAVPVIRQQGGGTIVNVSSPMARMPFPTAGPYSASKAALDALSEALRLELERDHINVMLVYPGFTQTEFFKSSIREPGTDVPTHPQFQGEPPERIARRIVDGVERGRTFVWYNAAVSLPIAMVAGSAGLRRFVGRQVMRYRR